jgi:hypothetical protein
VSCSVFVANAPPLGTHSAKRSGRCGAALTPCERGPLSPLPLVGTGTCSQVASRAQGSARRCPTPRPVRHPVRPPRGPRKARPRSTTGAGTRLEARRHWGAITGPWWSLGAPARPAGRRLSVGPTAGRRAAIRKPADAVDCLGSTSRGWKQPCLADFNRKHSKLGLRLESTRLWLRSTPTPTSNHLVHRRYTHRCA